MPKGEGQEGKKRGPYKKDKDDVEIRRHKAPHGRKPPRVDMHKLIVPEEDPDLISDTYKPKKKSEDQVDRVISQFKDQELEKMAQDIYAHALENHETIWTDAYKRYPDSNGSQALPASEFILGLLGELYSQEHSFDVWAQIRSKLFSKVHAGLT